MQRTILFLCPHAAAKSVMAAAYCRQMLAERGLDFVVTSAGTEPSAETAPHVVELLRSEGIDVSQHVPRTVTADELNSAFQVISMGCEVGHLVENSREIVDWNDVPPPSEALLDAQALIKAHVEALVENLVTVG